MRAATAGTAGRRDGRRSVAFGPRARWIFLVAGLALFAASAAMTVLRCASMPAMDGMPMPGGGTMSARWMRMPGQGWPAAAASFLGMWLPMMVAMMLPWLLPVLWRCHRAAAREGVHPGRATLLVGLGYFLAWTLAGLVAYPLGMALASIAMRLPVTARAVACTTGAVVLLAGLLQFSRWKVRLLACCRAAPAPGVPLHGGALAALGYGLRLGRHCIACGAGATAVLFALGWMDLRVMVVVTAAITAERLAPGGMAAMRVVGGMAIAAGAILLALA